MIDIYKEIGKRIKQHREKNRMTQANLAELTGFTEQHISNVERANTKLSVDALIKIIEALDVSADEILCGCLYQSTSVIRDELAEVVQDLDSRELKIIFDLIIAMKASLRKHYKEDEE